MSKISVNAKIKEIIIEDSETSMLLSSWEEAKSANSEFRDRAVRNYRYYLALQNKDVIKNKWLLELSELGLEPKNYNLIQMYVEGHIGNFANFKITPKFTSQEDIIQEMSVLNDMYFIDSQNFGYDKSQHSATINGCVIRGIEEIKIVRSPRFPLGRLKFESIMPTDIIFDPAVKGDNIARESKLAYKQFLLTPAEMIATFPHKYDEIQHLITSRMRLSASAQDIDGKLELVEQQYWNQKMSVLEIYRIYPEKKHVVYDVDNDVVLPDFGEKHRSSEDVMKKQQWAMENGIQISSNIHEFEKVEEKLYITTLSPDLNAKLENRPDERQILDAEGKCWLPFFTWSFMSAAGQSIGVPDLAIDTQDDINLRELTKSKILHKTPQGKMIINELAYGSDAAKKSEIADNLNDPSVPLFTSADAPPNMPLIHQIGGTQVNPEVTRDETFKISLLDKQLRITPAMQGQSGKSGESALLHSRKVQESNSMLKNSTDSYQDYQLEKAFGWEYLAITLYGGRDENDKFVKRDMEFKGKDRKIIINETVGFEPNGEVIQKNAISNIDPYDIIIEATKKTAYSRALRRETNMALLQSLPPTPENAAIRAVLEAGLIENIEELTEEQRKAIDDNLKLSIELSNNTLIAKSLEAEQAINTMTQQGLAQFAPQLAQQPEGQTGIPNTQNRPNLNV